jgi:hypothetical protein
MTSYPHPHRAHLHWPRVNLWLVAVVVLAAALIGLGAWVLVDRYTGGSTATENATSLIDNFNAAISRNDGKAIAALLTSDAVFFQRGSSLSGANAIAKLIAGHAGAKSVTRIAPVSVNGEYATTFIHFRGLGGVEDWPQLEVFQIKDGKIARIWGFLLGETPPFENIARS